MSFYTEVQYSKEDRKEQFEDTPDMKKDGQVKHFWAFIVWNRGLKKVQVMEVSQKTIMTPMKALFDNPKWGNPVNKYDITITRKGTTKNDTEYAVMPNPAEPNDEEMENAFMNTPVNLEALFASEGRGDDPFKV